MHLGFTVLSINVWDNNGQGRPHGREPLDGSVGGSASQHRRHDVGKTRP